MSSAGTTSLPEQGETATCAGCGQNILWEFDDPDSSSDNPFGWWYNQAGMNVCGGTDGLAEEMYHGPEGWNNQ